MLGLGSNISKLPSSGATIVTDNLVLRHGYAVNPVQPLSDGAAYFDGDDYITMNGLDGNVTTDEAFSLVCWFRCLAAGQAGGDDEHKEIIFSGHTSGFANRVRISINLNTEDGPIGGILIADTSTGTIYSDGSTKLNGTTYYSDGKWHHFCLTNVAGAGATATKIYINGVELTNVYQAGGTSGTATKDFDWSNVDLYSLGQEWDSGPTASDFFNGYMCNVGMWNVVLTQPQIKSIMWKKYSDLTSSETDDLVSWWNLDEETATDGTAGSGGVKDYNSTNHGTLA